MLALNFNFCSGFPNTFFVLFLKSVLRTSIPHVSVQCSAGQGVWYVASKQFLKFASTLQAWLTLSCAIKCVWRLIDYDDETQSRVVNSFVRYFYLGNFWNCIKNSYFRFRTMSISSKSWRGLNGCRCPNLFRVAHPDMNTLKVSRFGTSLY